MVAESLLLPSAGLQPELEPAPKSPPVRRQSLTLSASQSRRRHVEEIHKGNVNSLRHGVFAIVQNARDVATEIALTIATYPSLHPIADRRLVELLAEARVQRQRAIIAMTTEGLTPTLTSYDARLSQLEERLERTLYERERQRRSDLARGDADPLARYRSGGAS
jgi:hypothetical protein